jgi:hypothetical protein
MLGLEAMETYKLATKRVCVICNSDKTYVTKRGQSQWYRHQDSYYCNNCQNKLVSNPKRPDRNYPKDYTRAFTFRGKTRFSKRLVRKGICSQCGIKKGEKYTIWGKEKTARIHLHHIQYHDDDPLKDTVELCGRCHIYTTMDNNKRWGRPPKN